MKKNDLKGKSLVLFGDSYLSKKVIKTLKSAFSDHKIVMIDMDSVGFNEARMLIGQNDEWAGIEYLIIVFNIKSNIAQKKFLLDVMTYKPETTTLLIWDSEEHIKYDSKIGGICKSWSGFIGDCVKNEFIVKNVGNKLSNALNDRSSVVSYVISEFSKKKRLISKEAAYLFCDMVGVNSGLILSEIEKLCIACPEKINTKYISENVFCSSKDFFFYELTNIINDGKFDDSILMIDKLLTIGINENQIAEVMIKAARSRMMAAYFIKKHNSSEATNRLMKFNSEHTQLDFFEKKRASKTKTKIKTENIPHHFIAKQVVDNVISMIRENNNDVDLVVSATSNVYCVIHDMLAEVRFGNSGYENLLHMSKALCLKVF